MVLVHSSFDKPHSIQTYAHVIIESNASSFYSGSGGNLTNFFSTIFSGESQVTIKNENPTITFSNIIEYISSSFGLSMEDMRKVCAVQSRKTLYNWIEGTSSPRDSSMERIFNIYTLAKEWKNAGLPNKRQLLLRPVINNQSIFDLLSDKKIDKEKIMFAGSRLAIADLTLLPNIKEPFSR